MLALLAPVPALAQSYAIPWWTVDGGGGTSTGGSYSLSGTIGQPDASLELSGGTYSLAGGFWGFVSVQADLAVTILDAPDPVAVGGNIVYSVTVTNNGPASSAAATLTVTLANGLVLVSAPGCTPSGQVLTCAVGTLAASASQGFTVTATTTAVGTVNTTAAVLSAADPEASNDNASAMTTVTPAILVNDPLVSEGNVNGTLTFTVTLSAASSQTVTVQYQTADGSAVVGSDYLATSGTLTFDIGETSKPVPVTVVGDTVFEPNEAFYLNLSSPSGAVLAETQGVGTIANDDSAVGPSRVFVSVTGLDTNDCSNVATPCRTLNAAIGQVAEDGEVIVVKSGSYAGASITKSVKIDTAAGVVAFSGQPVTVNAGVNGRVAIRGLTLKAVTPGSGNGVLIQAAAAVFVERSVIDGWDVGIRQQGAAQLFVADTTIRNANTGLYATTGRTNVDDSRMLNNGIGIATDTATLSVRGSTLSGSGTAGVYADSSSSVTVEKCQISNNGTGISVPGSSLSTVRLSRTVVSGNALGLENAGGTLLVSGNSVVRGNTVNSSGTITTAGLQ